MNAPLPYGRQDIDERDIAAVVSVLRSDRLTQGPAVEAFERAVAERCGASFAIAVNSATSALHLACLALDVGVGDTVWTTPNTFVATANCAIACGAEVDFVDIDPWTWNLCPVALEEKLLEARRQGGSMPKVVIVVHFAGEPCDMPAIARLAERFGFRVVEDAAHAFGARQDGSPIGACRYSDITVFSFHPVKIITSAEGGMLLTRDAQLADRLLAQRTCGIWRTRAGSDRPLDEPWAYEQRAYGCNYRLSDVHAALGLAQLDRVDTFLARRHALAQRYDRELEGLSLVAQQRAPGSFSALHLYPVLLPEHRCVPELRRAVFDRMVAGGIGVNVHYIPVHTQPFQRERYGSRCLPRAEHYYARTLSLPLFGVMTFDQQDRVLACLRSALHGSLDAAGTRRAA